MSQSLRDLSCRSVSVIKFMQNSITLCPCNNSGCPVLSKEENHFILTDDYGGKVKLEKEELELLKAAIDELLK